MIQQKRFGRAVGLPSTVQIVRELMIIMRRDADAAAAALQSDALQLDAPVAASGRPSSLHTR